MNQEHFGAEQAVEANAAPFRGSIIHPGLSPASVQIRICVGG